MKKRKISIFFIYYIFFTIKNKIILIFIGLSDIFLFIQGVQYPYSSLNHFIKIAGKWLSLLSFFWCVHLSTCPPSKIKKAVFQTAFSFYNVSGYYGLFSL